MMPRKEYTARIDSRNGADMRVLFFENEVLNEKTPYVEIVPLPCLHYGHPAHQALLVKWAIDYIKAEPWRFGLFLGDMMENGMIGSLGSPYDDTTSPGGQIDDLIRKFKPIAHKIIAVIRGNHEKRTWRVAGIDPGAIIANSLEVPYLGIEGVIRLQFGQSTYNGFRLTYMVYAHHGWGGGRSIGSKTNNLERLTHRMECCDVYMMAHTHQQMAWLDGILTPDNRSGRIKLTRRLMVMCGAFLGNSEYAAEKAYKPMVPGTIVITLSGKTKEAYATVRSGENLKQI